MSKPTVLVVDDDPISVETMGQVLKDIAEICFAGNGRDALEQVQANRLIRPRARYTGPAWINAGIY